MPTSCCVPECTKKGYLDENGRKVSHFKFPDDPLRRKKWLHAIRRDEGVYFQIQEWTKVCSRHFREYEFIKTLSGRRLAFLLVEQLLLLANCILGAFLIRK